MAKAKREKIKLESSAGTGVFYTTDKNRRTSTGKLELMKYDKKARKHVLFKETKDLREEVENIIETHQDENRIAYTEKAQKREYQHKTPIKLLKDI